jgi:hypothetical protein
MSQEQTQGIKKMQQIDQVEDGLCDSFGAL